MAGEPLPDKKRPWWVRCRVLIYLLLGLLGLDCLVAWHKRNWQSYDPDNYSERVVNCRRQRPDLVLIGGSPVCEGIDPGALVGIRWHGKVLRHPFNLGLPGATTMEVWHGVKHGLASPPRLLVYGITASDLNDERMEAHGPASLMDIGDLWQLGRTWPGDALWCLKHYARARAAEPWRLWHYRYGIQLWAADRLERLWPGLCPEVAAQARKGKDSSAALHRPDGFAPLADSRMRRLDQLKGAGGSFYFHFLDNFRIGRHLTYLHVLLDWAAAHDVTMVLVDMPVSADLEEVRHPQEYATYRTALAEVEQQRKVVVLRPGRAALGITDADFADLIHMNASGTAKFSAWLRTALEDRDYGRHPPGTYFHPGSAR